MKPPVPRRSRSPTPITDGMSHGGRSEGPPPPWGLRATVGLGAGVGAGAGKAWGAGAVEATAAPAARNGAARGGSAGQLGRGVGLSQAGEAGGSAAAQARRKL